MTQLTPVVFLLDVDNTLLDDDRIVATSSATYASVRGRALGALLGDLREAAGGTRLRRLPRRPAALPDREPARPALLADLPLPDRLSVRQPAFPGSLDVIEQLRRWGPTVILSDGDVIFQPRKVERSGLFEAVEGRVLIYIHKERQLDDVEKHSRPITTSWWTTSCAS